MVVRLKLYLPKQKGIRNEMYIFFKIVPFAFNSLISVSFLLFKVPLDLSFMLKGWVFVILLILSISPNFTIKIIFKFRILEKLAWKLVDLFG